MIRIYVDTASDIKDSTAKKYNIEKIKVPTMFGEKEYIQKSPESFDDFYEILENEEIMPNTSQPSVGDLTRIFQDVKQSGDQAIFYTLSSGISGTYETALGLKKNLQVPNLEVVDTKSGTSGQQLLAIEAAQMRDQGASFDEIIKENNKLIGRLNVSMCLNSFTYLKKGGRIPAALAMIGNALNIKAIISFSKKGDLFSISKERGYKRVMKSCVSHHKKTKIDRKYPVFVIYTSSLSLAEEMGELLNKEVPELDIQYCQIGPVIGAHLGPDCVGLSTVSDIRLFDL